MGEGAKPPLAFFCKNKDIIGIETGPKNIFFVQPRLAFLKKMDEYGGQNAH